MSSVISDLLSKKPQVARTHVCLDPDLGDEFVKARQRHQRAQQTAEASPDDADLGAAAAEAEEAYNAALAAVKGNVVEITFVALDPDELDRIRGEHRPTDEQKREAQRMKYPVPEWNVDTFPPVLIAAACLRVEGPSGEQVGMSLEQAVQVYKSPAYNQIERAELFNTAIAAQMKSTRLGDIPKG